MNNTVYALFTVPATDGNFTSALKRASVEEINEAISWLKRGVGGNKMRIKACERELRKRAKNNG